MSIYPEKRKDKSTGEMKVTGRLVVEVVRNGKPKRKIATSQREARKLEAELRAGLHDGDSRSAATHSGTTLKALTAKVRHLWDETADVKQSLARLEVFMTTLGDVLREQGLPETVEVVRTKHITATAERLEFGPADAPRAKKLKGATINRYLAVGSRAFQWAEDEEIIEQSPRFKQRAEGDHEPFFLTEDDEAKLVACLQEHGHHDCVTLMKVQLATGCRINELLKRDLKSLKDDGDGWYSLQLGKTKTKAGDTVVMEASLGEEFKGLIKAGLPTYPSVVRRMKKARVRCNMPTTQPTHAHRHTIATRLSEDGTNELQIAHFMRHASLSTTKRYTHHNTATKKTLMKGLLSRKEAANG